MVDCETLDPLLLVGYEGIAAFLLWLVLLPAFQFIKCDARSVCTNGVIEDSIGALQDYHANPILILYSIAMIISVSILNVAGVSVTKYGSAAQRTTCDMMRNLFIWVFFILVPVDGIYLEEFSYLQLGGFILLAIGILVYNEILILPFFGLNKYTKIALEKRDIIHKK